MWQKLKREWKTAALAISGIILMVYDGTVATGMVDLPSLFPEEYRPWVGPGFLIGMLLLRRWREANLWPQSPEQ